ncbi:hypothetical protein BWI17_09595 [Betaproteobacteria bacterium GR16-43]|nr:hypothetical protein BWI17_09595 [Betaproteobacteria bacterium GR16-43]
MAARPFIDMQDYSPAARVYWWLVAVLGTLAIGYSLTTLAGLDGASLLQALVLATIAAVVGLFPVRIPGAKTSLGGAEIFIFLALLLYGPAAAVLAAALEGAVGAWRTSKRATSRIVTPSLAAIAMLACAWAFEFARAQLLAMGFNSGALVGALLVFSLVLFAANTVLTSMLFALKKNAPITPIKWVQEFGWIGLAYVSGASIAGLLFVSFQHFGLPVLMVAVPVIAMFLTTLHSYFQRKEDDERHMVELKESESRFHSAFTHAAIGMGLVSAGDGRFIQANRAFCEMLGRSDANLLATNLHSLVHADDRRILNAAITELRAGKVQTVNPEVRGLHENGAGVWMALNISLARDWQFRTHNLIVQAQDISARRRAEAELYHNAYHDNLTQLANRTHFDEQLNRAIARRNRHPEHHFAVMYLDFDRFKMVNDSLGHKAGDELLVHLAKRLKAVLRPTDVLARLGGDEFAILLEDVARERDIADLAERIQRELQKPFGLGTMEVTTSASIGITFSSNGYQSSDQIIRDADIAMYKAKSKGKAQFAIFDASLHQHVSQQLLLETELRRALGAGEIYLDYQPICTLRDRKLIGFEALARWRHPERGVLEPATFIPLAEETGLIVPLGTWVLREACRQMHEWSLKGGESLRMSVNVSSLQLADPEFVTHVKRALSEANLAPTQLTLEVTESVLMGGAEETVAALTDLRRMGITLSIDDFGTGYSSLSYLATLPIDALKVDRSFIEKMGEEGDNGEIVKAIFTLGQALSKQVFAEGIETVKQLSLLQEIGCEFGQGFLLSKPMDAHRAGGILSDQSLAIA